MELKHKMKELINTVSSNHPIEVIKAYDQIAEAEINWFILK